jgi:hypothetical protein
MRHQVFWFSQQLEKINDEAERKCKVTLQKEKSDTSHCNGTCWICMISDDDTLTSLLNLSLDKTLNWLSIPSNHNSYTRRNWLILNGGPLPFYWNWICTILRLEFFWIMNNVRWTKHWPTCGCTWARPSLQFGNYQLFQCLHVYLLQPFEHMTIAGCTWCTIVVCAVGHGFVLFWERIQCSTAPHSCQFVQQLTRINELMSNCDPKVFVNCDLSFCYSRKCQIQCVKEKDGLV